MIILFLVLLSLSGLSTAQATTYFISPSGSNGNSGTSEASPWLTFSSAIAAMNCGDTLVLLDGTYGDGTSTGKISIAGHICTAGNVLEIRALNQRQAKIVDNGTGSAVRISSSSYITIDGLYARSTDNSGSASGYPIFTTDNDHITIKNNVARNPNRYANTHTIAVEFSTDVLVEDNESYVFHRHCVEAWVSERVVVRRQYCNPRGGRIAGGFGAANGLGKADSLITMYPCRDCIVENSIADGTTNPMYLNEMNSTFSSSIVQSGSKVLGSICYQCDYGNGIYANPRNANDLNHTPQDITIQNNVFIDYGSNAYVVRMTDCVNCLVDHNTAFGLGGSGGGILGDQNTSLGATPSQSSLTVTNNLIASLPGTGVLMSSGAYNTWTVDHNLANGNGTNFNPSSDPISVTQTFSNNVTTAHGMGTCRAWIPDGAPVKGVGTSGSDIGANILYRYVDGVLTTTPLWDPITGEFPHGADDPDGTNDVAGASLKDFHTRMHTCAFPASYGGSGGGAPSTVLRGNTASSGTSTTASPLTWPMNVTAGQDWLRVCVAMRDDGANVGSVSAVDSSGQTLSLIKRQATTPPWRAVEMWGVLNPTAGSRTIAVTTTGNISGMVGNSAEYDVTGGPGTAVSTANNSTGTSMSVTALTNVNELVVDCDASSSSTALTAGPDQTALTPVSHDTKSILLGSSYQNGSDGGVMESTLGTSVYAAKVAVSLSATPTDPPLTAQITQTEYVICDGYGTDALVQCRTRNTASSVGPEALVRLHFELTGSVATTATFGTALYCDRNSTGYTRIADSFNSSPFRFYGPGPSTVTNPIPASGDTLTGKLGSPVTAKFIRDAGSSFVVPALTVGQTVEVGYELQLNASVNDVISCRVGKDDGSSLDVYSQTAIMNIRPVAGYRGF